MKNAVTATLGIAILGSVIFGATAAFGSSAPSTRAGGSVNVYLSSKYLSPNPSAGGSILFTGAIGDHGRTPILIKGKKCFSSVKLQKGTFEITPSKTNAITNAKTLTINRATCSHSHSENARVTVLDGTGLYAGINGTLIITVDYARVDPRYTSGSHKGRCNLSLNAVPSLNSTQESVRVR
jgi:hypothetical protein